MVLLGGSGPADRDNTIGRNKPFQDLAWAWPAAALLRFDRVTFAHPSEVKTDHDFTVADEHVPHAVAALLLLQQHPAVDAARTFLLGHSLGGTVAPRVVADELSIAGLVILAGGVQPHQWAEVRQIRYLGSLNPDTAAASEPAINAMSERAGLVDSPGLSRSSPASELPDGLPARTGWTCAIITQSRSPRRWASRCSSSRVAAITRQL